MSGERSWVFEDEDEDEGVVSWSQPARGAAGAPLITCGGESGCDFGRGAVEWGMQRHGKPVRKCHACALNLGASCWEYASPRDQWRGGRRCAGHGNEALLAEYRQWQKGPTVKTRKELRRESVGVRKPKMLLSARRPKRADRH